MSKGNKEEQKWLLGESLNQYDRSLKEELGKVEKRNREQNHKISALINAFDDDYIKKEEENTNISLDYSKEGIVIVDDIKGNTLVNNVKDSNKELVLNGDIDTQGVNVTLEDTVDNGKVDVVLEGNTEINLSKTKDPIMITHKFDDINSNDGKLQTTINEVTTVNDSPGKVDVKEITGDTLVNHVSNGSEELILMPNLDTNGYNNITLTQGIDGGKVDISLEGNTMVNVCDQEDPIAITKSYTVETGNHIALQGEYDGKCRPNIYGNTIVNLWDINKLEISGDAKRVGGKITITTTATTVWSNFFSYGIEKIKPSTTYSIIVNITKNTFSDTDCVYISSGANSEDIYKCPFGNLPIYGSKVGVFIYTKTTPEDLTSYATLLRSYFSNNSKTEGQQMELQILVLEGDYTNKPIPDYFTGMKSSFEDKLVPENLASDVLYNGVINKQYTNLSRVSTSKLKRNTKYTTFIKNDSEESIKVYSDNTGGNFRYEQITIPAKSSKVTTIITKDEELSVTKETWLSLDCNETLPQNISVYLVEGDYTNYDFTDYDSTKAGKYKVDYKVTGKNKLDGSKGVMNTGLNSKTICIKVKPDTSYVYSSSVYKGSIIIYELPYKVANGSGENEAGSIAYKSFEISDAQSFTTGSATKYILMNYDSTSNVQIEEGTTATTYEPYKESIKTLYLNSPLLEGDTIEQSGNNIIHNHRYTSVVFDGSNYSISCSGTYDSTKYRWILYKNDNILKFTGNRGILINDRYPLSSPVGTWGSNNNYIEGITINSQDPSILLYLDKYKDGSDNSRTSLIAELQQNPVTVVYELAQPTRETISTNDNLLLDSYTNGHLDVDTVVPIDKVVFKTLNIPLKYVCANTDYTIQFESDNVGKLYSLYMNGALLSNISVVKGLNKITCTTLDKGYTTLDVDGIGFNASKIVVTPKVDNDFGYFKGMKSVGECEGNKIEILSRNKNLFDVNIWKNNIIVDTRVGSINWEGDSFTITSEILDYYTNTGVIVQEQTLLNHLRKFAIKVKPNTQYTLSFDRESNVENPQGYVFTSYISLLDNEFKFVKLENMKVSKSFTFTTTNNTKYITFRFGIQGNGKWAKYSNIQFQEGSIKLNYIHGKQNKKEILLNEPLRGLPNGVRDKYTMIDGKWYIERNCGKVTFDSSEGWYFKTIEPSGKRSYTIDNSMINGTNDYKHQGICDKIPFVYWNNSPWDSNYNCISTINKKVVIYTDFVTVSEFNSWLQNNPITVIYQLQTPTYELIDYNPFEVYTDTTHISNNSTIPCNMVIKNSGYNTISLKENIKYTAYVNNKNNVSLTYKIDNNAIAVNSSNKFTFTTPSTLVDRTIRIASKGNKIENLMIIEGTPQNDPIGYFDSLKSSYECEKVTDVNDENFGKYKVDAKVVGKNLLNLPYTDGKRLVSNKTLNAQFSKAVTVGKTYTLSFTSNIIGAEGTKLTYGLSYEDNYYKGNVIFAGLIGKGRETITFTATSDKVYFIGGVTELCEYWDFQLEEGTKATEHEPYFESTQTVYLNSPLLKGDKIIWKDNKLQHYHKMKTIVFDGSDDENWTLNGYVDGNNYYRYIYNNSTDAKKNSLTSICDKLPTVSMSESKTGIVENTGTGKIQIGCTISTISQFRKYLQQNPITIAYELATPYYEEISEYPLKFSSIANCSLSTISNIQVSNISFNIYEETLPYLYNDKKYYITFNSDISKEIIINLGGSELTYTTKVGFNKVEITTPSNSNNMLTFNGQGVNINNVKVTQQNIDSYFEGMKSVGECEDLEIVSNNNNNTLSNKQTLTHEPLRGLPNGVKDKYVIIDGKWYIERNCIEIVLNGSEYWGCNEGELVGNRPNTRQFFTNNFDNILTYSNILSEKYKTFNTHRYDEVCIAIYEKQTYKLRISDKFFTVEDFVDYLQRNPTKVICQLSSPTYEPIDYNPFEVYTDITHISNNSTIPTNMVIKNTGYNCILKPNTKYTVVTNTQGSISAKIGSTKVDSTSNVFTIITPSTLTDSVLRFSGKGLTTKDIMLLEGDKTNYIPKYFTGMESAFEQEYDEEKNKYKVNVKVTDGNKENNITFYLNEPLRGVGDVKDKVYVKEDKVVVQRNCSSVTLDGNITLSGDVSNHFPSDNSRMFYIVEKDAKRGYNVICDKFRANIDIAQPSNRNIEGMFISISGSNSAFYFRILNSKLVTQDINGFKQWLQQNPTTVVYQLATPTYEEVECDLSKLMLENYENSSLILNSNIPPTVDVRYKGEVPIVSATKELSSNVESTTTDINENIIPYMCDMDYRIVELQLKNASTQGLEVNVLGLDSEDVLFNNRKANKIFNPSYEMLKRDILSKRYSTDEYKYRLERYLLANKISNEEYNELEELTVKK